MKLRELLDLLQKTASDIGVPNAKICGGTPRDKLMGRLENIEDLDLTNGTKTIDYLSQEFDIRLRKQYDVKRTVSSDGHSTIFAGNLKLDFSSNFIVPEVDAQLQKLGFDHPNDLVREMISRDFTCNALLMSLDLKHIYDPIKRGIPDIKDKMIRTCLSPQITLTSNRNRVIRAIYLACKLGFEVDPDIINFVKQNPETTKISTPKVMAEKIDQAFEKDASKASSLITQMGLWNYVPITKKVYPHYQQHLKSGQ